VCVDDDEWAGDGPDDAFDGEEVDDEAVGVDF